MKKIDELFKNYEVPEKIKDIVRCIILRFCINGTCDGMYIANVIANDSCIGDGMGEFYGDEISNHNVLAKKLQCIYGCNIELNEVEELTEIIRTGKLDVQKSVNGLQSYIKRCKEEKKHCDKWRVDYMNRCIEEAIANIEYIKNAMAAQLA